MLDPQKTREREALLKRIRELDAEIAQHERNIREGRGSATAGMDERRRDRHAQRWLIAHSLSRSPE
jgi:type II secretory pathway component PulM